jgi:hypothetical protein
MLRELNFNSLALPVLFFCSPKRKVPKENGAASNAGRGLRGECKHRV